MIEVGMRIERIKGAQEEIGNRGSVIEVNESTDRARIRWDHSRFRTWMAFTSLKQIHDGKANQPSGGGEDT